MTLGIPVWAVWAIAAVVATLAGTTVAGAVGALLTSVGAAAISVMILRPLARTPSFAACALVVDRVDAIGGRVKIGGEE